MVQAGGVSSTAGHLLVSIPDMGDDNFEQTVVLMLEHDEQGALGVVLNRPSGTAVAEHLGLRPRYFDGTNIGGSSFQHHLLSAALALEAHLCDVALICYGSNQRSAGGRLAPISEPQPFEAPYRNNDQKRAIADGDLSGFFADVDFGKLRAGTDDESGVPTSGYVTRVFASHSEKAQGRRLPSDPGGPAPVRGARLDLTPRPGGTSDALRQGPQHGLVVHAAFDPTSALGGAAGYTIAQAIRMGIARGVFSNAAGLGSAHGGTHHLWHMQLSSAALVILVPLFIFTFGSLAVRAWTPELRALRRWARGPAAATRPTDS